MSLRSQVEKITVLTASAIAKQIVDIRFRELMTNQSSTMGTVTGVNGSQVTLNLANGNTVTVTNVGGRNLAQGDGVATDGANVSF